MSLQIRELIGRVVFSVAVVLALVETPAHAAVVTYGTPNLEGYGYPQGADPTAGATLQGLAPGVVTVATNAYGHTYPFSPAPGDYPGTHQIYVGSNQTAFRDGYSQYSGRLAGPQVFSLDYSSLVTSGQPLQSLTLGIGADDFQYPSWHDPFTATVNGIPDTALSNQLMALNQTGPYEQFFTIGIDPAILKSSNTLTISIDEGGDGGDGWAVDFLTLGAGSVPEPTGGILLLVAGSVVLLRFRNPLRAAAWKN